MSNMNEINVRPAVKRFAIAMETVLRKHDAEKGVDGWHNVKNEHLVKRLEANLSELEDSIRTDKPEDIMERCVDIANLAMMRFDNEFTGLRNQNNDDSGKSEKDN